MEKQNKEALIEQLKNEIEFAKRRIEVGELDLVRVTDDMNMLEKQVNVRPARQPHQTSQNTSSVLTVSMLSDNNNMGA